MSPPQRRALALSLRETRSGLCFCGVAQAGGDQVQVLFNSPKPTLQISHCRNVRNAAPIKFYLWGLSLKSPLICRLLRDVEECSRRLSDRLIGASKQGRWHCRKPEQWCVRPARPLWDDALAPGQTDAFYAGRNAAAKFKRTSTAASDQSLAKITA